VNAYLPSTVFPTGLSADGLPIGLQAVSAPFRDYRCIEFARLITQEMGGFVAPSQYP
jgi:amidase